MLETNHDQFIQDNINNYIILIHPWIVFNFRVIQNIQNYIQLDFNKLS